jgi:hypothetical protein
LLLHDLHSQLGIDRRVYLDIIGFQGAIDYRTMTTTRDLFDRLRALGITHVAYIPGPQASRCKQQELLFHAFVTENQSAVKRTGPFVVFPMPAQPPAKRPPLRVATFGLGNYRDGTYDISSLGTHEMLPAEFQHYPAPQTPLSGNSASDLVAQSDAVLWAGAPPDPATTAALTAEFEISVSYPGLIVYVRKPATTRRG